MSKPVFGVLQTKKVQTPQSDQHHYISLFKSIIQKLATSEISLFKLVSEAEQASLGLGNTEDKFSHFLAAGLYVINTIISWTVSNSEFMGNQDNI